MGTGAKKQEAKFAEQSWPSGKIETTVRTRAAVDMVRIAESLGFYDRLALVVSRRGDIVEDNADGSPRPEERRDEKWRSEEKGFASEGPTNTEKDGESNSLARTVQDKWSLVVREMRRKKRRKKRGGKSRD